ncbi:hypothetical protein FHS22_005721 [Planomonospora venezuelensis]|uniref:Uncharacterized protein n=1 Tax=Planomonospora venezuelensis TaxID=1999 RepID=A0A841D901_PLAVE|nr:hypothetical protein [Planomonospora venezuelensis]
MNGLVRKIGLTCLFEKLLIVHDLARVLRA